MAHPLHHDTRPISFTHIPVAFKWVIAPHSLFLYSDPPRHFHPPSDWLRLFSSQTFSHINTPTFSTPLITDCELRLKVSWCGEPPSTATRQILTLTEGWPSCLTRKRRAAGASRPVEAIPAMAMSTKRIAFGSAERLSATLTEVFHDFPHL